MSAALVTTDVVFVYGALRSGTTLLRLMLQAHPGIHNPGEADFLFDHLRRDDSHPTGWRYDRAALGADRIFRDRGLTLTPGLEGLDLLADLLAQVQAQAPGQIPSLNVHRHIDRLIQTLPGARMIHLVRDPRDVAQSSIGMGWAGTLEHGVGHWIDTESAWERIAPRLVPGQSHEMRYETLFSDIEAALRATCDFLGLAYDPAMLDYHLNTSYGPPDPRLVNQWKRRSDRRALAPLEARAADLMRRRGYELSGPLTPPGPLARLRLGLANRIGIWRFGIARFGVGIYVGEKVTRWLGLSALYRRLAAAKAAIALKHLK